LLGRHEAAARRGAGAGARAGPRRRRRANGRSRSRGAHPLSRPDRRGGRGDHGGALDAHRRGRGGDLSAAGGGHRRPRALRRRSRRADGGGGRPALARPCRLAAARGRGDALAGSGRRRGPRARVLGHARARRGAAPAAARGCLRRAARAPRGLGGVSVLGAFLRLEVLHSMRALRVRAVGLLWVGLSSLPAIAVFLRRQAGEWTGASTYAAETLPFLVPLTAMAAFLLASDALTREREEGSWTTLALCPASSAGYVLRRWASVLALLLVLSAVPLLLALALAAVSGVPLATGPFAWPWLLRVAPAAIVWSALGLGSGTAAGSLLGGAGLALVAWVVAREVANRILFHFGLHLDALGVPLQELFASIARLGSILARRTGAYAR